MSATDVLVPVADRVSGDAAAAILLTLLGDQEAAAILSALNPDEARRIGIAMLEVAKATAADVETALDMFVDRSRLMTGLGLDAEPRVRSVFAAALGDVRAENLLEGIASKTSVAALEKLRWMTTDAVATALANEQAQVGALILACLSPEAAAAALRSLEPERQSDLIFRAASLGQVSGAALADLEMLLDRYATGRIGSATVRLGGRAEAAKIVTHLPKGMDQRVLKALKKRDKSLAQSIEEDMFVFDDLAKLDTKNMGILLRTVDTNVLTLALRGADLATVDAMLGCLSARAAETIRDEMSDTARVKRSEVEQAQKEVAATARRMSETGELNMGGDSGDYI